MSTSINHPTHYNSGKIEVIEAIEDWKVNFHRGNAIKYIARAGKKDPKKEAEDLGKAVWYLKREIELLTEKTPRRPNDMNPITPGTLMELCQCGGVKPASPSTSATGVSSSQTPEGQVDTAQFAKPIRPTGEICAHDEIVGEWHRIVDRFDPRIFPELIIFIPDSVGKIKDRTGCVDRIKVRVST